MSKKKKKKLASTHAHGTRFFLIYNAMLFIFTGTQCNIYTCTIVTSRTCKVMGRGVTEWNMQYIKDAPSVYMPTICTVVATTF